jgi:hypothetical protein
VHRQRHRLPADDRQRQQEEGQGQLGHPGAPGARPHGQGPQQSSVTWNACSRALSASLPCDDDFILFSLSCALFRSINVSDVILRTFDFGVQ